MSKKQEFMPGTNKGSQFLVIAKGDHCKLGIRPLFDVGEGFVVFGCRIRNQYVPGEVTHANKIEHLVKAFPLPYNNKGVAHVSVSLGCKVKTLYDDLMEMVDKLPEQVMAVIAETVQLEDPAEVQAYLTDFYKEECKAVIDQHTSTEVSNVLKLVPKDKA